MQFCISIITNKDAQNQIEAVNHFLQDKTETSPELTKTVLFTIEIDHRLPLEYKDVEVIPVPSNLTWNEYLKFFDSYFDYNFHLFFDQPIYIVLHNSSIVTSTLLLKAIEHLGHEIQPVYYCNNDYKEIHIEDIAPKNDLKSLLVYFLKQYNYRAALDLIEQDDFYLGVYQTDFVKAIKCLIKSMICRLNWDFDKALEQWEKAEVLLREFTDLDRQTRHILIKLNSKGKRMRLEAIKELTRQLTVRLEIGDTAAYLTRLYRFREMVIRYIWDFGQKNSSPLHQRIPANVMLSKLGRKIKKKQITGYDYTYSFLNSPKLNKTLDIRNRSFIGHGRTGFSQLSWPVEYSGTYLGSPEGLEEFEQEIDNLLKDLGTEPDNNYSEINRHLFRIVKHYL